MKINRKALLETLNAVRPGLGGQGKDSIPQSADFVFLDGRVRTFNDEISISAPIEGLDFEGAIPGDALFKLLDRSQGEEIELTTTETEVRLKAGRIKAGVAKEAEISLPFDSIESPKKWHRPPETFREALKFAMFACGKDLSLPVLTCVRVRGDGIVEATDNYRATRYEVGEIPINEVLIPAKALAVVVRYPFSGFAVGKAWAHFRTKEDVRISVRIHAGKFPDIDAQNLFVLKGKELALPQSLGEALDRILIFSDREYFLDERAHVTLAKKRMRLRAESPKGWVEEEINSKYDGEPVAFFVHPQFLKDMSALANKCTLGKDRMRFDGTGWSHVVALTNPPEEKSE